MLGNLTTNNKNKNKNKCNERMPGTKRPRTMSRQLTTTGAPARRLPVRRKGKGRNRSVSVPRNKLGFPQSMRTTLRYVDRVEINVNSLENITTVAYSANGLYDPYIPVGGHQPRGFDEYMALYKTYTCIASKMNMTVHYLGGFGPVVAGTADNPPLIQTTNTIATSETAARSSVMCGIQKGTEQLPNGETAASVMEKDKSTWQVLTEDGRPASNNMRMTIGEFFGKGNLVGADGYTGTDGSQPANQVYYNIWAARTSNFSNGICKVVAYVTIEYDVVFTEPKLLSAS